MIISLVVLDIATLLFLMSCASRLSGPAYKGALRALLLFSLIILLNLLGWVAQ